MVDPRGDRPSGVRGQRLSRRTAEAGVVVVLLLAGALWRAPAAQEPRQRDHARRARAGSQLRIPLGSLLLPGLGQYIYGAYVEGAAFTVVAAGGYGVATTGDADALTIGELPRDGRDQLAHQGAHVYFTAGTLSLYDAFRRAVPALRTEGKYDFLQAEESVGDLLWAPFDVRFLGRWTTWLNLAYTVAVVGVVAAERDEGSRYEPYRARDAAFITSLSVNAGVGEEALFRGWLLPVFHENFGRRFWLANSVQAGVFGAAHVPQAKGFAIAIAAWALYEGWLVRRSGWSIRESIFHHFWYDVAVGTATLLVDEVDGTLQLSFPTLRF